MMRSTWTSIIGPSSRSQLDLKSCTTTVVDVCCITRSDRMGRRQFSLLDQENH